VPRFRLFHFLALCFAVLTVPPSVRADWPPEGKPLCAICNARNPKVVADGTGGAFVVWQDERDGNDDIYLQRLSASGDIAVGWPADGLPVCTDPSAQFLGGTSSDGSGGILLVWADERNVSSGTDVDIYAQRVRGDASIAPGWPVDGAPVTRSPHYEWTPSVVSDGSGGAFFTWSDLTTPDVFAQHLTTSGAVTAGWPADGLAVCTLPSGQGGAQLAGDGDGGLFIAWGDLRDGPLSVYAQRITATGQAFPGWPVAGFRIALGRGMGELAPDDVGGAYASCATPGPVSTDDLFLQRFTGTGGIVASWPQDGATVCQAPDEQVGMRMAPDGAGGALLVWSDYRDANDDDIFAMRIQPDGNRAPGWPVDGLRVTNDTALDDFPNLAPDQAGGVYLCWDRYTTALGDHVMVQHLTGLGTIAPGWPAGGQPIPGDAQTLHPVIAADGTGGAIAAWERGAQTEIRALRFAPDGPVAVTVSLASVEANPTRVLLLWRAPGFANMAATVERRTGETSWEVLGTPDIAGPDGLRFEDHTVIAGARYAYRLSYREGSTEQFTAESWVDVPPALQLALEGFRPNPAVGAPVVAFELRDESPATLEVMDVTGRRVSTRALYGLGAGRHALRLDEGRTLAAGVYLVRLQQAGHELISRGVVIR
jgi:hypothetical protein